MMSNDVFANGREISCKKADGKSICAFPDVCFTPPQTPATPPGVPIPYPNTAFAKDTKKGSKNVKISGQEVMLKNKSYFKKSTGDEAGRAPKKGIVTSKITGKVYFTSWSPNVKFEGKNVVRHLDLTTHNHGSKPGNSPPWLYKDSSLFGSDPCKQIRSEVEKKCTETKKVNKKIKKWGIKKKVTIKVKGIPISVPVPGKTSKTKKVEKVIKNYKNNTSPDCCKAKKCVLAEKDRLPKCCGGKTKHHIIPDHCFRDVPSQGGNYYQGIQNMKYEWGACICLTGKNKNEKGKPHSRVHQIFDPIEDSHIQGKKAGTWTFAEANEAGAKACAQVTGCDKECLKHQTKQFYKAKNVNDKTVLRADSSGNRTSPDPSIMGTLKKKWFFGLF
jgi:hypothetical protein